MKRLGALTAAMIDRTLPAWSCPCSGAWSCSCRTIPPQPSLTARRCASFSSRCERSYLTMAVIRNSEGPDDRPIRRRPQTWNRVRSRERPAPLSMLYCVSCENTRHTKPRQPYLCCWAIRCVLCFAEQWTHVNGDPLFMGREVCCDGSPRIEIRRRLS